MYLRSYIKIKKVNEWLRRRKIEMAKQLNDDKRHYKNHYAIVRSQIHFEIAILAVSILIIVSTAKKTESA